MALRASELYAISQSACCTGRDECHWCGAPCDQVWLHDDPPPVIGIKGRGYALRPANHFICVGCWLFRRKRLTVYYLDKQEMADRQCPLQHSWLVTPEGAWGVRPTDAYYLYKQLLNPPRQFWLAILDGAKECALPLAVVNNNVEVKANTPLRFTVNNIPFTYSVYELEEALSNDKGETNGHESGVRELLRLFGPYDAREKKKRGRPAVTDTRYNAYHLVLRSGV